MSIKEKAISGVIWNSAGRFIILGFEFITGIILARLLSPDDFGLVGMVTIFLVLSETLINSGFSQALIRKPECSEEDYATAFMFNLLTSAVLVITLYFVAPFISKFYENPGLSEIIRALAIGLCLNAVSFVQRTKITRQLDFEKLTKISVIASIGSGVMSIVMAMNGFGVWSLIGKTLSRDTISCAFLWIWSRWTPIFKFYKNSFTELFSFGSRLVMSGLIGILTNNIVYVVLGKYFLVSDVGYYNRAELFKNLPSQNIENIITSVGYPVLAKLQNQPEEFKTAFQRMLLVSGFIISVLMSGLFGISQSMVVLLLGDEWTMAAEYLMYLCPVGLLYPLWTINLNVFNIVGRADLYLRMQFFMQILTLASVISAIFLSIQWMILFLSVTSLASYILFAARAQKFTRYTLAEQSKDILPGLAISVSMGVLVYFIDLISVFSPLITLCLQLFSGAAYLIMMSEWTAYPPYLYLKKIISERIKIPG